MEWNNLVKVYNRAAPRDKDFHHGRRGILGRKIDKQFSVCFVSSVVNRSFGLRLEDSGTVQGRDSPGERTL